MGDQVCEAEIGVISGSHFSDFEHSFSFVELNSYLCLRRQRFGDPKERE